MIAADPYDALGVLPGCSEAQIKRAYRDRARGSHPDGDDDGEWHEIRDAYELLIDPRRRKRYDAGEPEPEDGDNPASLVASTFDRLAGEDIRRDLVDQLVKELIGMRAMQRIALREAQLDLERREELAGRITYRGATSTGVLGAVVGEQINEARLQIAGIEAALDDLEDALEIASQFEDGWEAPVNEADWGEEEQHQELVSHDVG